MQDTITRWVIVNVFLFSCSCLSGREEEGGSAWERDERDEQGRVRDKGWMGGTVRNSRREELAGRDECDGARQSGGDEGVGDRQMMKGEMKSGVLSGEKMELIWNIRERLKEIIAFMAKMQSCE